MQYDFNGTRTVVGLTSANLNLAKEDTYTIYPSPAKDEVNVVLGDVSGVVTFSLCDLAGKELFSKTQTVAPFEVVTIRPSKEPVPGIYVLAAVSAGSVKTFKVIFE